MAKPVARRSPLLSALAVMTVVVGVFGPICMYQVVVVQQDYDHHGIFPGGGDSQRRNIQQQQQQKEQKQEKQRQSIIQISKEDQRPQKRKEVEVNDAEQEQEQRRPQKESQQQQAKSPPEQQQQQQEIMREDIKSNDNDTFPDGNELSHYEQFATKSSYDPALHPVYNEIRVIKTRFVSQKMTSGKVKHVFLEGMEKSNYIDLVKITSLPLNETYQDYGEELWIDDSPFKHTCKNTEEFANIRQQQQSNSNNTSPIIILQLDYKDFERMGYCEHLHEYIVGGRQNIRYAKRSLIEGRQYNYSENGWIDHGHFRINDGANYTGGPTIHAPYTVRTDQVELILSTFWNESWPGAYPHKKWDVAHFWSVGNDPVSHLRNQVTQIIRSMKGMKLPNGHSMRCFANLAGNRGTKGRKGIQEQYVEMMLKSKIIVVTQRDPWEGHYRLMEALASGAMVVADLMLSLPKGLKDRQSVVLFRTEAELREVLQYYVQHEEERIQIARKGWEVVMSRHRAWHRLEELLFGRPLTDVDNPYGPYKNKTAVTSS